MIPSGYGVVEPTVDELRERYVDYRLRQARHLVRLLSPEAVRPIYRRAIASLGVADGVDDPLGVLLRYCEGLLPLPPFEAWVEDALRNPAAYLTDLDDSAVAPTAAAPATIEALQFASGQERWIARLRGFRDRDVWRGFIAFEGSTSRGVHHTTLIFREPGPAELRERFLAFEATTLDAFLRSTLP